LNPISNLTSYRAEATPKEIFIRIKNNDCYSITSFLLITKNCPPTVYNYVSSNNDGANDTFHVDGLRDIFMYHKIEVYNRWGKLIWTGTNDSQEWDGYANSGLKFDNKKVPIGTYYYVIYLNDPDYLNPIIGWLYFGKSR
jgi:gliding motility-associated-like protein